MGIDPGLVEFSLNTDYLSEPMPPTDAMTLIQAWQQGGITREDLFEQLQKGEIISEAWDYESWVNALINDEIQEIQLDMLLAPPEAPPGEEGEPPPEEEEEAV